MSTTGDPAVGRAEPWALAVLTRAAGDDPRAGPRRQRRGLPAARLPGYPDDEAFLLAKATLHFDRARHPVARCATRRR